MKYIKNFVLITETYENKYLYHGSNIEFDEFDDTKLSTGDASELFGKGYYLTDNIKVAKFYAKEKAKKDKITKWTHTGIFGLPVAQYSKDADDYAESMAKINVFKIKGKILNIDTYIIDDNFLNYMKESHHKHSSYGEESYKIFDHYIGFLRGNKSKIHNYRGELEYVIHQIVLGEKEMMNDIVSYIRNMGYDGLKFKSNQNFEGNFDSWNYVIYNKNIIKKLDSDEYKMFIKSKKYNIL
jgi:hypothetical protein